MAVIMKILWRKLYGGLWLKISKTLRKVHHYVFFRFFYLFTFLFVDLFMYLFVQLQLFITHFIFRVILWCLFISFFLLFFISIISSDAIYSPFCQSCYFQYFSVILITPYRHASLTHFLTDVFIHFQGFETIIKQHFKLRGKSILKQLSEWGREGKSSQNQIILTLKTNFELALRNV